MNSLSAQVTITNTSDNIRSVISNNQTTQCSSSNVIVASTSVTASTWTALSVGSCADVLNFTAWNDANVYSASVVQISGSGTQGQPIGGILIPDSVLSVPFSGSVASLAAKIVNSYPASISASGASSNPLWVNGIVQYSMQQS